MLAINLACVLLVLLLVVLGALLHLNTGRERHITGGMECPGTPPVDYYDQEDEVPGKLPFRKIAKSQSHAKHIGQLKLLLSEIEFLTRHGGLARHVLYIAAAPGEHIPFLAKLFPKHVFHLYDPATFRIDKGELQEVKERIHLHNKFFTDDTAEEWRDKAAELGGVLLVSDIRSSGGGDSHENHVEQDNAAQRRWCETIRPRAAMLKFRWPFKAIDDPTYLWGRVMTQAFPPKYSAETRLIIVGDTLETCKYDVKDYEERMFFHNVVTRNCSEFPDVPWHDTLKTVPGMNQGYDCARMVSIVDNFLREAPPPGKKLTAGGIINSALAAIKRSL